MVAFPPTDSATPPDVRQAAADRQDMEEMITKYEAGIADVLRAYEGAALAYASAVVPTRPIETFSASSTSPFLTR